MNDKYIIEQLAESRWFFSFKDVNEKGEELVVELIKCEDNDSSSSLPKLWHKKGYIDRVLANYWNVNTYVKDTEGNSFGMYNPQHKFDKIEKRTVVNFNWMFEATEENKEILIKEIFRLFSSAKGETATEEKNRKIKEYAIENDIDIYKSMPKGWDKLKGATTAPLGTVWISNMQTFKSGNRKQAILILN